MVHFFTGFGLFIGITMAGIINILSVIGTIRPECMLPLSVCGLIGVAGMILALYLVVKARRDTSKVEGDLREKLLIARELEKSMNNKFSNYIK
jgi:hypothetical protein